LIGGEILTPELAREILGRCGELWNLYGPTETTVWSTVARIENPDDITLGRIIPNQRAYIVDRNRQRVPIGVPGELWIGGVGVGRHYVAQPDLTNERFVPDPFTANGNARVYRTGDLCRYRSDGKIEFLGRIDHQIKIRGFRVEPGEIETLLIEHPGVSQCAVIDRVEKSGDRRLVGYVVPSGGDDSSVPDAAGLKEFLRRKLPDYMVPAAFVVMNKLPLTRTGKVERAALPAPEPVRPVRRAEDGPRTETEKQIARIWEDLLPINGIGLTDDFFQIGGHSLLAVSVMTRINAVFGLNLPVATIFRAPTVEALANAASNSENLSLKPPGLISLSDAQTGQNIFWAPSVGSVERFVECHRLARLLCGEYRFVGFDPAPELTDIDKLAQHCLKLIRSEQPHGPYFLAGYCQCGHVAYEIATRLERDGEEVGLLAILDSSARDFDPTLRQRIYWVRDGLTGHPRAVLKRIRSVVYRKLGRNGSNGHRNGNGAARTDQPMNRFKEHVNAVNRHRVGRFSGAIHLVRSDEWLATLPHTPKLGWDALAKAVKLYPLACGHTAVLTDPASIETIAHILKEAVSCRPV
ncbi:MAG TPA: AMP-binding protein, partial [Chthoniobacterales bacterium]|nr:AMP-binding protein [Chthoniobacterales bacterium]